MSSPRYTKMSDFTLLFDNIQLFDEKHGALPGGTMAVVKINEIHLRDLGARMGLTFTRDQIDKLIEILHAVKAELEK